MDKKLAVLFFYSKEKQIKPLDIWNACGVKPSTNKSNSTPALWGELSCDFHFFETFDHYILFVQLWQSEFLEKLITMENNNEDIKQMPLIQAFMRSIKITIPEVAYIATHLHQSSIDYALNLEWAILSMNADYLSDERFGLLYLNEDIGKYWTPNPLRDDRAEIIQESNQKLVFAGYGKEMLL